MHLLFDVSGACMCVDIRLCYQCTLLPLCLCEQEEIAWIKIVQIHICIAGVHIVSVQIVRQCISANCVYTHSAYVHEAYTMFFVHLLLKW